MRPTYQHRLMPVAQFRATPDGVPGRFEATVLTYNTVDDYMTAFEPGVFTESMDTRMPRVVWAHDWSEPLGRWTQVAEDTEELLRLVGEFDSFDEVPRARQAYHQLGTGTIDQFSVGFMPLEMGMREFPVGNAGATHRVDTFIKGRLDEVSLVLVGAVYGTGDVALRFGQHPGRPHIMVSTVQRAVVDLDLAAGVILDLQTGKVDIADALMTLKNAGVEADEPPAGAAGEQTAPVPNGSSAPADAPASDPPAPAAPCETCGKDAHEGDCETDSTDDDAALQQDIADALALLEGVK